MGHNPVGTRTSLQDVCKWTGSMKMSWRRLDAFLRAMSPSNDIYYIPLGDVFNTSCSYDRKKTTRRPVLMTFAIGLEACRCLEDVLMPSSKLCHYQIKYFKAPLVTSSTRHVHKTTRRPPEDQSSWRLQVHLKIEDVLKTSWYLLQGCVTIKLNISKPNWWRLQHVMFIRPQEDHPKTSPHGVCKCTWRSKMCWRRLDTFFRVVSLSN